MLSSVPSGPLHLPAEGLVLVGSLIPGGLGELALPLRGDLWLLSAASDKRLSLCNFGVGYSHARLAISLKASSPGSFICHVKSLHWLPVSREHSQRPHDNPRKCHGPGPGPLRPHPTLLQRFSFLSPHSNHTGHTDSGLPSHILAPGPLHMLFLQLEIFPQRNARMALTTSDLNSLGFLKPECLSHSTLHNLHFCFIFLFSTYC